MEVALAVAVAQLEVRSELAEVVAEESLGVAEESLGVVAVWQEAVSEALA
jgi:hypothetical protein|tara:strand:+ start:640 stop:789 length:150 start_codon:yes stop_codon:yes gene_type:complete